ncbi:thiamine pyrophosphate-dependent enzyme, partial [Staphylococcus saprophyticus]|uniref:thiamine pyrophosphate-dependent enzyme n=1 Tax=Staphylococcus saprophyticus TaxID=29385 RepID=UPI001C92C6A7
EGINFGCGYKAPGIFVMQNKKYGMCRAGSKQRGGSSLGEKGIGCGMGGLEVDGMDGLGVYEGRKEGRDRGVNGDGRRLIERIT